MDWSGTTLLVAAAVMPPVATAAFLYIRKHPEIEERERREFVLRMALVAPLPVFLGSLLLQSLNGGVGWVIALSQSHPVLVMLGAIALSVFLFYFRKKHRILYGATECLVGVVGLIAYPAAQRSWEAELSTQTGGWVFGIMGFIYIIVRGLDNIDQGSGELRKEAASARQEAASDDGLK